MNESEITAVGSLIVFPSLAALNWPGIASAVAAVSGVFTTVALVAAGYFEMVAKQKGSAIEDVAGNYQVSAADLKHILATFTDDDNRLEALDLLLKGNRGRAKDVLKELKSAAPAVQRLYRHKATQLWVVSAVTAGFCLAGVVAARQQPGPMQPQTPPAAATTAVTAPQQGSPQPSGPPLAQDRNDIQLHYNGTQGSANPLFDAGGVAHHQFGLSEPTGLNESVRPGTELKRALGTLKLASGSVLEKAWLARDDTSAKQPMRTLDIVDVKQELGSSVYTLKLVEPVTFPEGGRVIFHLIRNTSEGAAEFSITVYGSQPAH